MWAQVHIGSAATAAVIQRFLPEPQIYVLREIFYPAFFHLKIYVLEIYSKIYIVRRIGDCGSKFKVTTNRGPHPCHVILLWSEGLCEHSH